MSCARPELELVRILADHAPLQTLAAGELLLRRGEALDHVIVVVSGELQAGPTRRGAAETRVLPGQALAPPGGVGAWATSPVDLRATVATRVYRVGPELLLRLMAKHAGVLAPLIVAGEERAVALGAAAAEGPSGALVVAYGPRGGCGTTTGAVLTAARAARRGRNTLLVDVHRWFGTASLVCETSSKSDLLDVLLGDRTAASLMAAVEGTPAGFDVLAAPASPERGDMLPRDLLPEILALARSVYDVVVVDLEAGLDPLALDVLELTGGDLGGEVLLFLGATIEGAVTGRRCLDVLDHLGVPMEAIYPILNRHHADGPVPEAFLLRKSLGRESRVVVEDDGELAAATARGDLARAEEVVGDHGLVAVVDAFLTEHLGLEAVQPERAQAHRDEAPAAWIPRLLATALGTIGLRWMIST